MSPASILETPQSPYFRSESWDTPSLKWQEQRHNDSGFSCAVIHACVHRYFGAERLSVCSFGFEPNPLHQVMRKSLGHDGESMTVHYKNQFMHDKTAGKIA